MGKPVAVFHYLNPFGLPLSLSLFPPLQETQRALIKRVYRENKTKVTANILLEVQQAATQEPIRNLTDYPAVRRVIESASKFVPVLQQQSAKWRREDNVSGNVRDEVGRNIMYRVRN